MLISRTPTNFLVANDCVKTLKYVFHCACAKLDFAHALIKKHARKLSFSHVLSNKSVRYSGKEVILSLCGLFTLAPLERKHPREDIPNYFFALVSKITISTFRVQRAHFMHACERKLGLSARRFEIVYFDISVRCFIHGCGFYMKSVRELN